MEIKGIIKSLSIGKPKAHYWKNQKEVSGIDKSKTMNALLTKEGFIGDGVANTDFHGGPDRAVCLYPYEHYQMWGKEFKKVFNPPSFGENICVSNMIEKDVFIGDIFSLGEAMVQITQGRIPCSTISKHNGEDKLLGRIVETGYTGYFFRVLEEGRVGADSCLKLVERKQENISVLDANYTLFHNRKNRRAVEDLLEVQELAGVWREKLEKALL
ncbi:MOSC domain-containing protein YiiM [Cytobacillus oceanisediminis]|jgi:MOSC domain-containing protein YiiM|uniref:MOSC domain-containing protein YiiM n=1 Tax=Cytobacillus oceanisediminis TaxID=665099 RepID=A0A2V2ZC33_9BACI|nr:MOSC domain-containing protein [Cytobacillus oceanisediminis]PWW17518.1 MOSC domain-containing protein YiiM [Cytobacillus oceanisediminis]